MKTVQQILTLSSEYLSKHGIDNARREAETLLADVLGLSRVEIYLQFDRPLIEKELEKCRHYLQRRAKGEPLAYIHGEVEFYHCKLKVTQDVLIPRQETEILVDIISQEIKPEGTLWDLCCGSGCVAISLKKQFPNLTTFASDISPAALKIAQENAKRNAVDVTFLEGDLLTPFKGQKAHFVVCNPPYISEKEYQALDKQVKDFEPRSALVAGPLGTEYYQRLAKELPEHLFPGSKVWFEIGYQQGDALKEIFEASCWKKRALLKDWSGKNRFFFLEIE